MSSQWMEREIFLKISNLFKGVHKFKAITIKISIAVS